MKNKMWKKQMNIKNDQIIDHITGKELPWAGAEANRQEVETVLLKNDFDKKDIKVDLPVSFDIDGTLYKSFFDLVIFVGQSPALIIKCVAGSLDSCKMEVIAAARIVDNGPAPFAAASDGKESLIWRTCDGELLKSGKNALFNKTEIEQSINREDSSPLSKKDYRKACLVFRTYDAANVHKKQ